MEAAIDRVEQVNGELNAVIHPLFDEAREAANGELPDGPFKGVPFLLKDLGAAFAGQPLHMGMQVLKEADFTAPMDTYLAQRFRDAGLITIGKTNTPELGILPTTEPVAYGATNNPWDTTRSPGGSSGGSGAAVASGMVPMAHANDGGGSIRIPASNNGLVGPEADPAADQRGTADRRQRLGPHRRARGLAVGPRHRPPSRRGRRARPPAIPTWLPSRCAPTSTS